MKKALAIIAALGWLLSGCGGESSSSDDDLVRYANEIRECADKYVAQGMSRQAAVYGPCAIEVQKPGKP